MCSRAVTSIPCRHGDRPNAMRNGPEVERHWLLDLQTVTQEPRFDGTDRPMDRSGCDFDVLGGLFPRGPKCPGPRCRAQSLAGPMIAGAGCHRKVRSYEPEWESQCRENS